MSDRIYVWVGSAFSHHQSSQGSTRYYNLGLFAIYLFLITLRTSIFSTCKTSVRVLTGKVFMRWKRLWIFSAGWNADEDNFNPRTRHLCGSANPRMPDIANPEDQVTDSESE
jgi:hypothetical protein